MNGIVGMLHILRQDCEEANQNSQLELIDAALSSCNRLKKSYTNLITSVQLAKISAATKPIKPTEIKDCIRLAITQLKNEIGNFKYNSHIESALLNISLEHLLLILNECFDNACKFGNPKLGFLVEGAKSKNKLEYILTVRDYGNSLDYSLFDTSYAFCQPNRLKLEQQGWGIGLFLIQQIAKKNHITWSIKAAKPGTIVTFNIPIYQ